MCFQSCGAMFLFVLFRLASFAGDGLILYDVIDQFLSNSFDSEDFRLTRNISYCEISKKSDVDFESFQDELLYSLVALAVIVGFSLFISPALLPFMVPRSSDVIDADDDDDVSIDYEFRMKERGGRRTLRYIASLVLIFIHDVPTCALGTFLFATIVAPAGPRCLNCVTASSECKSKYGETPGWPADAVFPMNNDYFWLAMVGGKILATIGTIGLVAYFELQYRYQIHELKVQRRRQLLRRHFGPDRGRQRGRNNYFGVWLLALLGTSLLTMVVVAMMLAPTISVIVIRLDLGGSPALKESLEYSNFACWGCWAAVTLAGLVTTYTFAYCRKTCSPSRE